MRVGKSLELVGLDVISEIVDEIENEKAAEAEEKRKQVAASKASQDTA